MKLFINQTSPYARKARVVAHETGAVITLVDVDPWNDPPELLAVSPLSKVPVLVAENDLVLTESDTITRYLAALDTSHKLLPADALAQNEMAARTAMAQGMIDAAFDAVIEKRRPAVNQWPEWVERQRRAVRRGLEWVATQPHTTNRFDLGDVSLACLLGYLDFRHPTLAWRVAHPGLAAWFDQVSQRPSLAATNPDLPIA
ncbi:MAG: glutathione S-transferase N-terminal domain-containing protein [Betaproteobacteria bacterium]